jgi:phosphomevalonate kinase
MLIGVSGKMGTGKDYFVENYIKKFIENELKEKCLILSFADMIKINLMVHHDIQLDELYGYKSSKIRNLLQLEGTEKGRNVHGEDIWIRYVKAWSELFISRGIKYFIIPDVRFKNELEFIKKNNGIIFRIYAPNRNEKRLRNESLNQENYEKIKNHQSEIELDDFKFDIIIDNDNILDEDNINNILSRYICKCI